MNPRCSLTRILPSRGAPSGLSAISPRTNSYTIYHVTEKMSRTFFEKIKKVEKRRGWDSNPRNPARVQRFSRPPPKPLGHPSRTLLYFIRKLKHCQEWNSQFAGQQHGKELQFPNLSATTNMPSVFNVVADTDISAVD